MITPSVLIDVLDNLTAKIPLCGQLVSRELCGWDCCHFTDNYILMFPGEWDSAIELGWTLDQYEVLDPCYLGGTKVIPRNRGCCSQPDNGPAAYKPLDCRLYPYWAQVEGEELFLIQGRKCPIIRRNERIDQHRAEVSETFERLALDSDAASFLERAQMVGYERVPDGNLNRLSRLTTGSSG